MTICTSFDPSADPFPGPLVNRRGIEFQPDMTRWLTDRETAAVARRSAAARLDQSTEPGRPEVSVRRLVGVVAAVVIATVLWSVGAWLNGPGLGVAPVGADLTDASVPFVIVEEGDTLWSIAAELEPGGNVRALVDRLAQRNGGTSLVIGQRLVVGE